MSESRRKLLGLTRFDGEACERPARVRGPNADYFPNVALTTHERRQSLFYDDLLAGGRTVLIHCTSIAQEAAYPVLGNLAAAQSHLGARLGRDVFFYSLAVDPADTPEALADLARRCGAGPGWLFLAGEAADVELLRGRLFAHNGPHPVGPHGHGVKDCSVGLARYGNESIGLWGACPARANPLWIARRLSWVVPRGAEDAAAAPRRGGPHPHTYRS
jgi:protein SCO1/2